MFTGIIETISVISALKQVDSNLNITIKSEMAAELKIDQSVAHNGVCLTVIACNTTSYTVTAVKETLDKTTLKNCKIGHLLNLERAMKLGNRLDGHIVQGHVDQTGTCIAIESLSGSWQFTFSYDEKQSNITIEKGSITINGVSLTVVNSKLNQFSVAIIPYTFEHTNFKTLEVGTEVNLEFDMIGKYVSKLFSLQKN